MGILYGNKYEEDTTEKHDLSKDDIDFLKNLQTELNTQSLSSYGQAPPAYWGIRQVTKVYHVEDDISGYDLRCNGADIIESEDIIRYIGEDIIPDLNTNENVYELHTCTFEKKDNYYFVINSKTNHVYSLSTILDIESFFRAVGLDKSYEFISYRYIEENVSDAMFLTHKAAEEHLSAFGGRYDKDARVYAMTALNSPEIERLLSIIQTVSWENVIK